MEQLWIEVKIKTNKFFLSVIYRHPQAELLTSFLDKLENDISLMLRRRRRFDYIIELDLLNCDL